MNCSFTECSNGGGLLLGEFWGIMGDKKGRLSVLFGSIIIYSLANVLNGFVTSNRSITHTGLYGR